MCRKIQGSYYIPRRVGTEGTFFDCFLLWEKKKIRVPRWRMGVGKWRDKLTTNWAGTVGSVSIFFLPDSFAEIINYVPKKKRIRVFFHCRIFGEKNKTGGNLGVTQHTKTSTR
jgi:hypothetical protein